MANDFILELKKNERLLVIIIISMFVCLNRIKWNKNEKNKKNTKDWIFLNGRTIDSCSCWKTTETERKEQHRLYKEVKINVQRNRDAKQKLQFIRLLGKCIIGIQLHASVWEYLSRPMLELTRWYQDLNLILRNFRINVIFQDFTLLKID